MTSPGFHSSRMSLKVPGTGCCYWLTVWPALAARLSRLAFAAS